MNKTTKWIALIFSLFVYFIVADFAVSFLHILMYGHIFKFKAAWLNIGQFYVAIFLILLVVNSPLVVLRRLFNLFCPSTRPQLFAYSIAALFFIISLILVYDSYETSVEISHRNFAANGRMRPPDFFNSLLVFWPFIFLSVTFCVSALLIKNTEATPDKKSGKVN
jgi:hypothetical protein